MSRYKFDAFTAQGRLDVARAMIEGELDWSDRLLDIAYQCQLCGACDLTCGRIKEINPCRVIEAIRARLVKEGKAPPPELKAVLASIEEYLNPYEKPNSTRGEWVKGLYSELEADGIKFSEPAKGDTVLYVGCIPLKDAQFEQQPKTAVKLLQKAGMDISILGERERCCGYPSLKIGDQDQFIAFAKENIKMFHEMGVKQVVCTCAYCYATFKRDYPEVGETMNFEVVHIVDVVDRLIKDGRLKPTKAINMRVTYHDPCHLGRMSQPGLLGISQSTGLYQQPRDILNSIPGVEVLEMDRNKEDTYCCGAGSWMQTAYPDFAQWVAGDRMEEAKSTGADAVVTCCPHCEDKLGNNIESAQDKIKIYDLLDLVLEAI